MLHKTAVDDDMAHEYCVTTRDYRIEVPIGTTYGDIMTTTYRDDIEKIVLVKTNGKLQELSKSINKDCVVEPVTLTEPAGFRSYQRSMTFLFLYAVKQVLGEKKNRVILHFSAGPGFYFTIEGDIVIDESFLAEIRNVMKETVDKKLPFIKKTYNTEEARKYFRSQGMFDKDALLRFRRSSWVNLYSLGGMKDYFYGYMVPDTSYLSTFELYPYADGILLAMAGQHDPDTVLPMEIPEKLFATLNEHERKKYHNHVENVADLNASLCTDGLARQIIIAEAQQERNIAEIAQEIAARDGVKFVLIAGPSSSGKTTFCNRLSTQLMTYGLDPHPISLDNYYRNREECPKDAEGNYDYECLEALDVALFQENMQALLAGESVDLPVFNFKTGRREYHNKPIRMKDGDILVLEGIHGLSEKLTENIPAENKFRIYISALTCLNVDDHNRISTRDGRLLRRIVRDYRTRATSAQQTISMWPKVQEGEEKYIFPNQGNADAVFNSALIYELGILKTYAEPLLYAVPEGSPEAEEARRLLKFLEYFLSLPQDVVPNHSILREFIGGSVYNVG